MKKKLLSILMVFIMVLSCVACGNRDDFAENRADFDVEFGGDPTIITYLTIGDKPINGQTEEVIAKLNELLIKKVNCKLDILYISWSDYLENYNRTLSNGKYDIDLVGTATDWLDAWPNVFNGNFMPLTNDMLQSFCPRTYASVTREQWKKCSYEGNIYFIPENEYSQWTNHGFIYRSDVAKAAGLDEINSWSELDQYVKYVAQNRPDMEVWFSDGSNTTFTLGYLASMAEYYPIYEISTYGLWGARAENMTKIVSPYYEGQEFIDFARLMKEWQKRGVWETAIQKNITNETEFYSGVCALEQHHTQKYYTDIKPTMEIKQQGSNVKFFWFGEESGTVCRDSILHGAMAVYANSKNPEKALMVYDILRNDPECYRLLRYGIEGVQYELSGGGMLQKPSGYNADRDSIVTNFWWGRRDVLEIPDSSYAWDDYYKLIDEYEHVAIDYPWDGIAFATPKIKDDVEKILEICNEYIPEISYAQYEGTPEEEVAEFRKKLKDAGFENVTRELQLILNTY